MRKRIKLSRNPKEIWQFIKDGYIQDSKNERLLIMDSNCSNTVLAFEFKIQKVITLQQKMFTVFQH